MYRYFFHTWQQYASVVSCVYASRIYIHTVKGPTEDLPCLPGGDRFPSLSPGQVPPTNPVYLTHRGKLLDVLIRGPERGESYFLGELGKAGIC